MGASPPVANVQPPNPRENRMRTNLPVTQQNYDYPGEELLVYSTNTKGEITHCNQAFVRVSGYGVEELVGQPHNIIRHLSLIHI